MVVSAILGLRVFTSVPRNTCWRLTRGYRLITVGVGAASSAGDRWNTGNRERRDVEFRIWTGWRFWSESGTQQILSSRLLVPLQSPPHPLLRVIIHHSRGPFRSVIHMLSLTASTLSFPPTLYYALSFLLISVCLCLFPIAVSQPLWRLGGRSFLCVTPCSLAMRIDGDGLYKRACLTFPPCPVCVMQAAISETC